MVRESLTRVCEAFVRLRLPQKATFSEQIRGKIITKTVGAYSSGVRDRTWLGHGRAQMLLLPLPFMCTNVSSTLAHLKDELLGGTSRKQLLALEQLVRL